MMGRCEYEILPMKQLRMIGERTDQPSALHFFLASAQAFFSSRPIFQSAPRHYVSMPMKAGCLDLAPPEVSTEARRCDVR